jgi:hypothetical protein
VSGVDRSTFQLELQFEMAMVNPGHETVL